ncbi:MAG: hypothetical protein J6Y72_09320 [Bacteroidales bacterium]|jgi:3-hydroxyacyl-[acyl-carrier-protein] dehydratase|nr:hypothetical protein [Bacteroidales bacterium]MBP5419992.1 hypothetical protein [Bacteroidales bacterium]MCR5695912.1 hypothetical protein [Marinilabiliaceae bacterium]
MTDFYNIISNSSEGNKHAYVVKINEHHRVFEGHFPGNPIVPGVMSLMMIRECAERQLGHATRFAYIKDVKYIQAIVPNGEEITIKFDLDGNNIAGEVNDSTGVSLLKIKATLA